MNIKKSVYEWNTGDVATWLGENGLSAYQNLLCEKHKIDGPALMSLTEDDLRKPPVQMMVLGMVCKMSSSGTTSTFFTTPL